MSDDPLDAILNSLLNLMAYVLVSALGAYFLAEQFGFQFWPAVAGCFFTLFLVKAHGS